MTAPASRAGVVIGLTGGIGSGKSTVAGAMADRGAAVIDVDALGREVLEPDGGAYEGVVEAFGPGILAADGTIDRARLAQEVFGGSGRLDELEALSHPAINTALADRLGALDAEVVVLDMAVLAESRLGHVSDGRLYHRVVVVETPVGTRLVRLAGRGMSRQDAIARMESQATDDERRRLADLIVPNGGTMADLQTTIALLWPTVEAWAIQQRSQDQREA